MFKQQYIADGGTAEEIDSLVETMLNLVFDGYEQVKVKNTACNN